MQLKAETNKYDKKHFTMLPTEQPTEQLATESISIEEPTLEASSDSKCNRIDYFLEEYEFDKMKLFNKGENDVLCEIKNQCMEKYGSTGDHQSTSQCAYQTFYKYGGNKASPVDDIKTAAETEMVLYCKKFEGYDEDCATFARDCYTNLRKLNAEVWNPAAGEEATERSSNSGGESLTESTTVASVRRCTRIDLHLSEEEFKSVANNKWEKLQEKCAENVLEVNKCIENQKQCIEDCAYQTLYKHSQMSLAWTLSVETQMQQYCQGTTDFNNRHPNKCKTIANSCFHRLKCLNDKDSDKTSGENGVDSEDATTPASTDFLASTSQLSVNSEESTAVTEHSTTEASTTTLTSTIASSTAMSSTVETTTTFVQPKTNEPPRPPAQAHVDETTFTEETTTIDPEIVEFRLRRKKMEQEERDEKKRKEEEEGNGRVWVYVLLPLGGVLLLAGIIGGVVFWRVRKSRKERRKREEEDNRLSNPRALEAALRKQNQKRKVPPKKENKKPAKAPRKDMHFTPIKKDKFKQEQVLKVEAGVDAATVVYEEEEAVKSRSIKDLDFNFDRNRIVRFGDDVGLDEEKKEEVVANEVVEEKKEKTELKEIAEEKKEIVDEKAEKTETKKTSMVKDASQKTKEIEKKEAEDEKKDKKSNKKSEKSEKKSEKTQTKSEKTGKKSEKTEKKSEKTEMKEES